MSVPGNPPEFTTAWTTVDGQPCKPQKPEKPPKPKKPAGSSTPSVYTNNDNTNNSHNNNAINYGDGGQSNAGNVTGASGTGSTSGHSNNGSGNTYVNNGIMFDNNVGDQTNVNTTVQKEKEKEETDKQEKPKVSRSDADAGRSLAEKLHAQTYSKLPADNERVVGIYNQVNSNNAYSFFKEYNDLADNDRENIFTDHTEAVMNDTYRIWDPDNDITIKNTSRAVDALLTQAAAIGLDGTSEFQTLQTLNDDAKTKQRSFISKAFNPVDTLNGRTGADLSRAEAQDMDDAIRALVLKMDEVYRQ